MSTSIPNIIPGSGIASVIKDGVQYTIHASGTSRRLYLTQDLPYNAIDLVDVSGMEYFVGPNQTVYGEAVFFVSSDSTTTALRFAFNGPATPNYSIYVCQVPQSNVAHIESGVTNAYDYPITPTNGNGPGSTILTALLNFFVQNGANAGNLVPRFSSETTSNVVTIHKGSYIEYRI